MLTRGFDKLRATNWSLSEKARIAKVNWRRKGFLGQEVSCANQAKTPRTPSDGSTELLCVLSEWM